MTNEGGGPGARRPAAAPAGGPGAGTAGAPASAPAAAPGAARPAGAPAAGAQRPAGGMPNMGANKGFEVVLVDELIPYVDANFRTIADQAHRAMAGLSMGGMETKSITLARPDVFSSFGLLSGGTYSPDEINGVYKDKSKVKFVFLSCGSFEGPDNIKKAAATLKDAGFNAVGYISEGTRHEFQTWRRSLLEMAPLLFK